MRALRTQTAASLNQNAVAIATALWAAVVGRVTPVRAGDVNPTRRAEDCRPYQYEPATRRWLQI
jgi:hypothetical protein